MADRNEKLLLELLKCPGNNECADCGSKSKASDFTVHALYIEWNVINNFDYILIPF